MQSPQVMAPRPPQASDGRVVAAVVGLVLVLPALVLTVMTLVIPTVRTVVASFHSESFIDRGDAEYVGFDNFGAVFEGLRFGSSVWFSVSLVLLPIVVAVVVAPLLAAAFDWAGGWARMTARAVLSFALVVFSPVALGIAWLRALRDEPALLADPDLAGGTLRTSIALMTFGVVCAVGVTVFLPVFRGRRRLWPTLFTVAGVVVLGMLAVGVQLFTTPYVMTGFGPRDETQTPVGLLFRSSFQIGRLGLGAAVSALLLAILAILGVAAVLLVILTRFRVSVGAPRSTRPLNPGAIVLAILALIAVVVVAVLAMGPWLDGLGGSSPETPSGTGSRTWTSAVLAALISVGVAYPAAIGISGLRPLGRHSEWLLMPFAPWLFVGAAPLGVEYFKSLRDEGEINTEGALLQPILVSIVSLVVLAVLCRGQSERWQQQVAAGAPAAGSFFRTVVLHTLPTAVLLLLVSLFLNAQDLFWPLLVAQSPENWTTSLLLFSTHSSLTATDFSLASATPLVAVILGFVALAAVQVLHLDRMVATVGRPDDPTGPIQLPVMAPGSAWSGAPGQAPPSGQAPQFGQAPQMGQVSSPEPPASGQASPPGDAGQNS